MTMMKMEVMTMVMVVVMYLRQRSHKKRLPESWRRKDSSVKYLKEWDHRVSTSLHTQTFIFQKEDLNITPLARLGMGLCTWMTTVSGWSSMLVVILIVWWTCPRCYMSGCQDWRTLPTCHSWAGSSRLIWTEWSRPLTFVTTCGKWGDTTSKGPTRACLRRGRNETGHSPVFATMWRPQPPLRWAKGPRKSPTSMDGTSRWCREMAEILQVNQIIKLGILHQSEWWTTSSKRKPMRSGRKRNNNRPGLAVPPPADAMVPALQLGAHHHRRLHLRSQGHRHLLQERTGWFLGCQMGIFSGPPRCPTKGIQSSSRLLGWTNGTTSCCQLSKVPLLRLPVLRDQHPGRSIWGEWLPTAAWFSESATRRSWLRTQHPQSLKRIGLDAIAASTCWRGLDATCQRREC